MMKIENALKSSLLLIASVLGLYGINKIHAPKLATRDLKAGRTLEKGYRRRSVPTETSLTKVDRGFGKVRGRSEPRSLSVYRGSGGPLKITERQTM